MFDYLKNTCGKGFRYEEGFASSPAVDCRGCSHVNADGSQAAPSQTSVYIGTHTCAKALGGTLRAHILALHADVSPDGDIKLYAADGCGTIRAGTVDTSTHSLTGVAKPYATSAAQDDFGKQQAELTGVRPVFKDGEWTVRAYQAAERKANGWEPLTTKIEAVQVNAVRTLAMEAFLEAVDTEPLRVLSGNAVTSFGGRRRAAYLKYSGDGEFTLAKWNFVNDDAKTFSGVSLDVFQDATNKRTFLAVSEGAAGKMRFLDISNGAAPMSETVINVAGPRDLAIDNKGISAYVLDATGGLLKVDLMTAIPCGNLFDFARAAFQKWLTNTASCPSTYLEDSKVFELGGTSWKIKAIKKTQQLTIEGQQWEAHKYIACSTPLGANLSQVPMPCCVEKHTAPETNNTAVNLQLQEFLSQF